MADLSPEASIRPTDNGTDSRAVEPLHESTVHSLLGNERRYRCLRCLADESRSPPVAVQTLADDLTAELSANTDNGTDIDNLRNSVYVSLSQTHLPKLDEAEIVNYDDDEQTVDRGPRFDALRTYLEEAGSADPQTHGWLVVPLVLSAVIAAANVLGLLFGGIVSSLLVLGIDVTAIALYFGFRW